MPNHITNVIRARKEILDSLASEEQEVDFNTVVPTPKNIFKNTNWNEENWGTKWNAYKANRVSDTEVRFQTANAHPIPVIDTLIYNYIDDEFEFLYADENIGYNCGHYRWNPIDEEFIILDPWYGKYCDESCDFATRLIYGISYKEYKEKLEIED